VTIPAAPSQIWNRSQRENSVSGPSGLNGWRRFR
jgi:hypothetical protein